MELNFIPRDELNDFEWDEKVRHWNRPEIDRGELRELAERNTAEGVLRLLVHVGLMVVTAFVIVYAANYSVWLAIPPFLFYAFLCGFLNGIEHELRHKIVFSQKLDGFSDTIYFLIHVLFKHGSRYSRVSHQLHHRYTMVRDIDPETDFPDVITPAWARKMLRGLVFDVVTLGIPLFFKKIRTLITRATTQDDPMLRQHTSDKNRQFIRYESWAILLINIAIVAVSLWLWRWEPIVFLILGPLVGEPIAAFWHLTEHIGMMHNGNDQRLCTRGVKVSPLVKYLYGGLDEHIEHHMFPAIPSRNLTKLRESMRVELPERRSVFQCWREILAIARHKENKPQDEFVPVELNLDR